jgi:uncharacterized Zn finger protein (UPF0148 family)
MEPQKTSYCCPKCGAPLCGSVSFCPLCGSSIDEITSDTSQYEKERRHQKPRSNRLIVLFIFTAFYAVFWMCLGLYYVIMSDIVATQPGSVPYLLNSFLSIDVYGDELAERTFVLGMIFFVFSAMAAVMCVLVVLRRFFYAVGFIWLFSSSVSIGTTAILPAIIGVIGCYFGFSLINNTKNEFFIHNSAAIQPSMSLRIACCILIAWIGFSLLGGIMIIDKALEYGWNSSEIFFLPFGASLIVSGILAAFAATLAYARISYSLSMKLCFLSSIFGLVIFLGVFGFLVREKIAKSKKEFNNCPKCGSLYEEWDVYCVHCGWTFDKGASADAKEHNTPRSKKLTILGILTALWGGFASVLALESFDPSFLNVDVLSGLLLTISAVLAYITVVLIMERKFFYCALIACILSAVFGLVIIMGAVGFVAAFLIYKSKKEFKPVEKKLIRRSRGI